MDKSWLGTDIKSHSWDSAQSVQLKQAKPRLQPRDAAQPLLTRPVVCTGAEEDVRQRDQCNPQVCRQGGASRLRPKAVSSYSARNLFSRVLCERHSVIPSNGAISRAVMAVTAVAQRAAEGLSAPAGGGRRLRTRTSPSSRSGPRWARRSPRARRACPTSRSSSTRRRRNRWSAVTEHVVARNVFDVNVSMGAIGGVVGQIVG